MSLVDDKRTHARQVVTLDGKAKLIISDKVHQKVHFMHHVVNNNIEWSGILQYKKISGNIENPETLVFEVVDFLPMDVGTSTYTEYDHADPEDDMLMDTWDKLGVDGIRFGHIHTHHSMSTFFSGTDMSELHDNAPKYDYYLSLIVDYKDPSKWLCKIAIAGEEEVTGVVKQTGIVKTVKKWLATKEVIEEEEDYAKEVDASKVNPILYIIDFDIALEEATEPFYKRVGDLNKKQGRAVTNHFNSFGSMGKFQGRNTGFSQKNMQEKVRNNLNAGKDYGAGQMQMFADKTPSHYVDPELSNDDTFEVTNSGRIVFEPSIVEKFIKEIINDADNSVPELLSLEHMLKRCSYKTFNLDKLIGKLEDEFENNAEDYFGLVAADEVDFFTLSVAINKALLPFQKTVAAQAICEMLEPYVDEATEQRVLLTLHHEAEQSKTFDPSLDDDDFKIENESENLSFHRRMPDFNFGNGIN